MAWLEAMPACKHVDSEIAAIGDREDFRFDRMKSRCAFPVTLARATKSSACVAASWRLSDDVGAWLS